MKKFKERRSLKSRFTTIGLSVAGTMMGVGIIWGIILANPSENEAAVENLEKILTKEVIESSFVTPTSGKIQSKYGNRSLANEENIHYGVDFSGEVGQSVFTVTGGIVKEIFNECKEKGHLGNSCGNGLGNYVQIQHEVDGQNFETVYAHLAKVSVEEGETVNKGGKVGTMGSSGNAAGTNLHFELHTPSKDNVRNAIDPLIIIPLN